MVPVTPLTAVVVLVELLEADGSSPAMVVAGLLVVGVEPTIEGVVVPGDVGGGVVGALVSSVVGWGDVVVGGEDVLVADVTDVVLGVVVVVAVVVVETLVEVTVELLVVDVGVTSNVVWVHVAA